MWALFSLARTPIQESFPSYNFTVYNTDFLWPPITQWHGWLKELSFFWDTLVKSLIFCNVVSNSGELSTGSLLLSCLLGAGLTISILAAVYCTRYFLELVQCIRALPKQGRYREIHPRRPGDFLRPKRNVKGRGKSRGQGMDYPIPSCCMPRF